MPNSAHRTEETETYLIAKYGLTRHRARRLFAVFGTDRIELDALLGATGRTSQHREDDICQTSTQVSFGSV